MIQRCAASLCLLLAPQVALAAPPEDRPPVQTPKSNASQNPSDTDQSVTENTADSTGAEGDSEQPAGGGEGEGVPSPVGTEADLPGDAPVDSGATSAPPLTDPPADAPAVTAAPSDTPADAPATGDGDIANLLDSDEPDQPAPRVRVSRSAEPERVDRDERLRNYYAQVYRPKHNPSRLYFAARGAYALSGTTERSGGGRMANANVELGQTWNYIGYGIGASIYAGSLTFGDTGVENFAPVMVGGGPSIGLGRLGLLGRGFIDLRAGYNFFYAPVSSTREGRADPPNAAPHGPKLQFDAGLLFHGSEQRRFRHGLGANIGWQLVVHSLAGDYPVVNTFSVGVGYFFG